jgi:hypothetical protein
MVRHSFSSKFRLAQKQDGQPPDYMHTWLNHFPSYEHFTFVIVIVANPSERDAVKREQITPRVARV